MFLAFASSALAGPTKVAQHDAGVDWVTGYVPVAKGSLFYAFFPHPNASAPLAIWLQGGPGASGIQDGLLTINGPLTLSPSGTTLVPRPVSWASSFAMLYVDSPVGTGYSYAANESISSYAASSYPEVSSMLTQLLDSVYDELQLWPRANPLLVTGESCPPLGLNHGLCTRRTWPLYCEAQQ